MSNMTENQRAGFERATYAGTAERIRRGSERGAGIYSAIALVIGIALSIGAVSIIEGWWQWLVMGVIIMTTIGLMIAVNPNRQS